MSNSRKPILFAVGGVVGVLVLVGAVVLLVLGVNARRHVQTRASDALGVEVTVGGRLNCRLLSELPYCHGKCANPQSRHRGRVGREALLCIEFFPLLQAKVRIDKIELKHVKIAIEWRATGTSTSKRKRTGSDASVRRYNDRIRVGRDVRLRGPTIRQRLRGRLLQSGREPPAVFRSKARPP